MWPFIVEYRFIINMLSLLKKVIVFCVILFACQNAFAQADSTKIVTSNPVKIGFVCRDSLISAHPKVAQVETSLGGLQKDFEKELKRMTSEYNKKVKDYLEKNSTFSKPIKLARQAEITETEKRIAFYKQRFEEVFSKEKDSLMMPIFQEVDSLIKSTSEELNLTVVINKKELLFFSADCIDLQPIIKQKLEKNATLK